MDVTKLLAEGELLQVKEGDYRPYIRLAEVVLGDTKRAVIYKFEPQGRHHRNWFNWDAYDQTNPYREELTQYLAQITGLAQVPAGAVRAVPESQGRPVWLQEFLPWQIGAEYRDVDYSPSLVGAHYDLLVFDILLGNNDRHAANWLFNPQHDVKAIDHGLAFRSHNAEGVAEYVGYTQARQVLRSLELGDGDKLPLAPRHLRSVREVLDQEIAIRAFGYARNAGTGNMDGIFLRAEALLRHQWLPTNWRHDAEFEGRE